MIIRPYVVSDEKGWVYTKALSYLFSSFFDDREPTKPDRDQTVFEDRIELVAEEEGQIVGLLDIDIYNADYSRKYLYAPADKVAYFTNLAVHPDYQGRGIAQALYQEAYTQLLEKGVEKLAIFTREGDAANHLYQKWGGQLVCQDWLVVGVPKDLSQPSFAIDLRAQQICLTGQDGQPQPYYLREGIYIVTKETDLAHFTIDTMYKEYTYVIELPKRANHHERKG
ncbi:N-acetyltransferase family protein [Streptococcus sp. E29BA]|uniref:GNAT family N-acetyltransferase n=1 Tax=Streptococcus sp. E29BA TaxID=3278716 RepID=UPI00359EAF32